MKHFLKAFSNSAEKASGTSQVKTTWGKLAAWICDKDTVQVGQEKSSQHRQTWKWSVIPTGIEQHLSAGESLPAPRFCPSFTTAGRDLISEWAQCFNIPVNLRLAGQFEAVLFCLVSFKDYVQRQALKGKKNSKSIIGLNFNKLQNGRRINNCY